MMNTIRRAIRPEQIRELSLLLIIVVVVLGFGTQIDNFFSGRTFLRISTSVAIIAVVAVGQTLVILTRNIDLSVGSVCGFTAYFTGSLLAAHKDLAPLAAIGVAMAMGAGFGAINGLLVAYGRVPAIIVTLGALAIYRGILVEASGAKTITTGSLPQWVVDLPRLNFLDVENLRLIVFLAIVAVIIFQLVLVFLPFGRRLFAIGSNPDAAGMAGLPVRRIVLTAFVLCGALSGLAGFLWLAQYGNITVVAAQGLELEVVAAAVVGGVNVFGGTGSMFGAMLGAVLIGTLEYGLTRLQISEFVKDALLGMFILLAVAVDTILMNRLRALWAGGELQVTVDELASVKPAGGSNGVA